jgi:hypothetical protein
MIHPICKLVTFAKFTDIIEFIEIASLVAQLQFEESIC